jgi:hypothetical protein
LPLKRRPSRWAWTPVNGFHVEQAACVYDDAALDAQPLKLNDKNQMKNSWMFEIQ